MEEIDALIEKIEDGDTSRKTADEVLLTCGWRIDKGTGLWVSPNENSPWIVRPAVSLPHPLTSRDAAHALMPGGWKIAKIDFVFPYRTGVEAVANDTHGKWVIGEAPTEAAARTIVALLAWEKKGEH
jgi:hypothetical protein